MKNSVEDDFLPRLDAIFAHLNPQTVEDFYSAYQQWMVRQGVLELQHRIAHVRQQQVENEQRIQQAQPSPIALAALARLQSNDVDDLELLDAMLDHGEAWLDQTMQRLNYCEQFSDFISGDYTQWCQRALEGAFDWIDSLRDAANQDASSPLADASEAVEFDPDDTGKVEALLLQKLSSEEEQDDPAWHEVTLKQAAIKLPQPESEHVALEETELAAAEEYIAPEDASPVEDEVVSESEQPALVEFAPTEAPPLDVAELDTEVQPALHEFAPGEEAPQSEEEADEEMQPALVEFAPVEELPPADDGADPIDQQTTDAEMIASTATRNPVVDPGDDSVEGGEVEGKEEAPSSSVSSVPVRKAPPKPKRSWIARLLAALLGV